MIFDAIMDFFFGIASSILSFLPDMPDLDIPENHDAAWAEGNHGYVVLFDGVRFISTFIDLNIVIPSILLTLGMLGSLLVFQGINWLFNKVRGAGG